jgi:tetratricopeptide (TPR) repeat protein
VICAGRLLVIAAIGASVGLMPSQGAQFDLPDSSEIQYYTPAAQEYYAAGIEALDRVDYPNAYNLLAKASALQPAAVKLNHIIAQLAVARGRQTPADEARDYYQTALNSYQNILKVPAISTELRRQIMNQLKVAQSERDNLAQRDVVKEAVGNTYILERNHLYAQATPRAAGSSSEEKQTTAPETNAMPFPGMVMESTPTPTPEGYVPPQDQGGIPGVPGQYPGAPAPAGGYPGAPGSAAVPL